MAKPELGTKRICVSCGARFFDLQKSPATCPKCGTEQPVEQPRTRRPANVAEDKRPKKPVPAAGDEAEADVDTAEDADEDVLEDTADLDEDEDALDDDLDVGETGEET